MKFIILGCGSSMGVPRADGFFGNCNPKNKKNYRTRCSALLQTKKKNILIDTSPDLRSQLLQNKIKKIDQVLYSHMHADQTHGINDLRAFYIKNKKPISVYADEVTSKYLKNNFSYCFKNVSKGYPITLKLNPLRKNLLVDNGYKKIKIQSVKVKHGDVSCICYIVNKKLAYISDVSEIFKKDFKFFKNLKYLIIDCLWYKNHPSHFNLEQSLKLIKKLSPKKAILTNLHSDLDYAELKKRLPKNVIPAYDGYKIYL
jgi:phosphoribosyl 1,2-cyclic phosphate phosphodiesterase